MHWMAQELQELWREKEILPPFLAKFLCLALPVLTIGIAITIILWIVSTH